MLARIKAIFRDGNTKKYGIFAHHTDHLNFIVTNWMGESRSQEKVK